MAAQVVDDRPTQARQRRQRVAEIVAKPGEAVHQDERPLAPSHVFVGQFDAVDDQRARFAHARTLDREGSPVNLRAPATLLYPSAVSIFLIRHGETDCNAARIVQLPDVPLSARGLAQADQLARRLAGLGIGAILSSDLRRAVMTAERIQQYAEVPLTFDAGLQERNFGAVRGQPYATLDVDLFAPDYAPPGGERWEEFHLRIDSVWPRVVAAAAATDGHLAVVTHGLVCHSLAVRQLDVGPAAPTHWHNASLTIVDASPPWAVRTLNCTAHLDEPGALEPAPA